MLLLWLKPPTHQYSWETKDYLSAHFENSTFTKMNLLMCIVTCFPVFLTTVNLYAQLSTLPAIDLLIYIISTLQNSFV